MKRLRNRWALLAAISLGVALYILVVPGRAPVTGPALANATGDVSETSVDPTGDNIVDGAAKTSVVIELLSLDGQSMEIIIEPPASTP